MEQLLQELIEQRAVVANALGNRSLVHVKTIAELRALVAVLQARIKELEAAAPKPNGSDAPVAVATVAKETPVKATTPNAKH